MLLKLLSIQHTSAEEVGDPNLHRLCLEYRSLCGGHAEISSIYKKLALNEMLEELNNRGWSMKQIKTSEVEGNKTESMQ